MKNFKLFFLIFVFVFLFSLSVFAVTLDVPGVYPTIQDGIDNATSGDVINVAAGTYNENLLINKSAIIASTGLVTINGVHTINVSDIVINDFTFAPGAGIAITIDSSSSPINNITVINNVFDLSTSPSIGVYVGGGSATSLVSDVVINDNVFDGPIDKVCNPWKIGGDFVGGGISVPISSIDFERNTVNRCSIPVNLQNSSIDSIFINDNVFRDTDGVLYFWASTGSNPAGVLSNFVFTNNDVDGTNTYGIGIDGWAVLGPNFNDTNFGSGNKINNNSFVDIPGNYGFEAVTILASLSSYVLNAENNWWGSCDGPSSNGTGSGSGVGANVSYIPWIGICITDKSNISCAHELNDVELNASLSSTTNINQILFSIDIDGVMSNRTSTLVVGNTTYYTINSSEFDGSESVTWNVYVEDINGYLFNDSWNNFYVRNKTELYVNPDVPDGSNGWYITEPLFTLVKDSLVGVNSSYRWDSSGNFLYINPFGLENIPNNVSAGILELNYWSSYDGCSNELEQNQTFKVDLTNPVIKELSPGNQSVVYNDFRPRISAYLDEIYSSNSGIDNTSIFMTVDGNPVNPSVGVIDSIDAILRYTPDVDLSEGMHTVYVYVEDNAGRQSELSWDFNISVTSIANMIVTSPENKTYGEKRILLNVSLDSGEIGLLEVMDSKDVKPKWKRLCKNCNGYGKLLSFKDGQHDLRIKVTDAFGFVNEQNISFEVDSKRPIINKIEPKKGAVTNGDGFWIKYTEENLKDINLVVNKGNISSENILSYCESGKNKNCSASLDLSGYDNESVNYWFNVSDYIGEVQSKIYIVKIDTTDPVITLNLPTNNFDYDSNKIGMDIQLSEKVRKLEYFDYEDSRPKWKMLCNKCNYYNKTKNFKNGPHDLDIRVTDEAGNSDLENVKFII